MNIRWWTHLNVSQKMMYFLLLLKRKHYFIETNEQVYTYFAAWEANHTIFLLNLERKVGLVISYMKWVAKAWNWNIRVKKRELLYLKNAYLNL